MRKKWFWLLGLPLVLFVAVLWVQNLRWKRVEADFRAALLREYASAKMLGIEVSVGDSKGKERLGFLKHAEVQALAPRIFLRHPTRATAPASNPPRLYFEGDAADFSIFLDEAHDGKGGNGVHLDFRAHKPLELTPESCRALRRQVMLRWAPEIAGSGRQTARQLP